MHIIATGNEVAMAKVFAVVPLELKPGVKEQDFIKFFVEEYAPFGTRIGWKGTVLKADRGERSGKLAVIWEMPSVENRDRVAPTPDQITEEGKRLLGPGFDEASSKLDTYVIGWPSTDYIAQGE